MVTKKVPTRSSSTAWKVLRNHANVLPPRHHPVSLTAELKDLKTRKDLTDEYNDLIKFQNELKGFRRKPKQFIAKTFEKIDHVGPEDAERLVEMLRGGEYYLSKRLGVKRSNLHDAWDKNVGNVHGAGPDQGVDYIISLIDEARGDADAYTEQYARNQKKLGKALTRKAKLEKKGRFLKSRKASSTELGNIDEEIRVLNASLDSESNTVGSRHKALLNLSYALDRKLAGDMDTFDLARYGHTPEHPYLVYKNEGDLDKLKDALTSRSTASESRPITDTVRKGVEATVGTDHFEKPGEPSEQTPPPGGEPAQQPPQPAAEPPPAPQPQPVVPQPVAGPGGGAGEPAVGGAGQNVTYPLGGPGVVYGGGRGRPIMRNVMNAPERVIERTERVVEKESKAGAGKGEGKGAAGVGEGIMSGFSMIPMSGEIIFMIILVVVGYLILNFFGVL